MCFCLESGPGVCEAIWIEDWPVVPVNDLQPRGISLSLSLSLSLSISLSHTHTHTHTSSCRPWRLAQKNTYQTLSNLHKFTQTLESTHTQVHNIDARAHTHTYQPTHDPADNLCDLHRGGRHAHASTYMQEHTYRYIYTQRNTVMCTYTQLSRPLIALWKVQMLTF